MLALTETPSPSAKSQTLPMILLTGPGIAVALDLYKNDRLIW